MLQFFPMKSAWRSVLAIAIVGAMILIFGTLWSIWRDLGERTPSLVYYSVVRSDLPIVVTERGALESQVETKIRCEVENMSVDRSGNFGTQILFIVPNGSAVKEGDVVVELDSAALRDRMDKQVLSHEKARSLKIQAVARFENQKSRNATKKAQAELNVELARLSLKMYLDKQNGTFRLSVEEVERQIDDLRASVLESQAKLELARTQQEGIEGLFELGYKGKSELDKTRFEFLQAENQLASTVNRIRNQEAQKRQLESYEFRMQKLILNGDVATTERELSQVVTDNLSAMAQAKARKIEAERSEGKEAERLQKLETQLQLCEIVAPHDGMVVYARSRWSAATDISEGATVRQRQEILTLPDLSRMQVKTQIHEAVLDQIRPGLPTTIRIDAFPNRVYQGLVQQVAVVPTSSYRSSVKTYECTVRLLERVEQLKPGMTAVVDMHVDRLKNVIAVPVQAIVQRESEVWCYVGQDGGAVRRKIKLGRTNDKFVHVIDGLVDGEEIVLNPMAILEETEMGENRVSTARVSAGFESLAT